MNSTIYQPGKLVSYRDREWIVMPSPDSELLMLKPMGGSDDEITGVFLPINIVSEKVTEARFPEPVAEDISDFDSAKLLFNATRLSFRNASGPFRCMGKLSFRPRSYQVVPLVMALQMETVKLLIADDVGIGKTVEALMILKELMERGEVKRFAVVCLPHLCEQWQSELKDKLDIDAEIIRSSTAAMLDRTLPDDNSVFYHIPYQVISIDYIKSDKRRKIFLEDCPEMVIVDEAHTCALPAGAKSPTQQQRFYLLQDIAKDENRHLLLLTATPHSGKDEEFQSLLGLLNKDFQNLSLEHANQNIRQKLAKHFIQRKRENIKRWLKEETPFPKRNTQEPAFNLSSQYSDFYLELLKFARGISKGNENDRKVRMKYWAALALLRGAMSSPATGFEMLQNRQQRQLNELTEAENDRTSNPNFEKESEDTDTPLFDVLEAAGLDATELREMGRLADKAKDLYGIKKDLKAAKAIDIIKVWLKQNHNPIVFCKYIATAQYIGDLLKEHLSDKVDVQIITSELADEQRREKISRMKDSKQRVMVATDCLSEGINLQDYFTSVLHYDLPWNPNRLEQREGRVDRFGQLSETVETAVLWGQDNPIDKTVLKILIRKVREIRRATGVSINLGEDNNSIMDSVIKEVLLGGGNDGQIQMFADDFITKQLEEARKKAENLKSIFAHESVPPDLIEKDLAEVDEAIGDLHSVEDFVVQSIIRLGGSATKEKEGISLELNNLPEHLQSFFPKGKPVKVSFDSPTPLNYRYLGRNHRFVEQLCQFMLSLAFESKGNHKRVARASVIRTDKVNIKTSLIQFRVRNVIKEESTNREIISEEMYLWGYEGSGENSRILNYFEAKQLLTTASSIQLMSIEQQQEMFRNELTIFNAKKQDFHELAENRAINLVKAHGRFKELVGGRRYNAVHPVLPPDIIGVYILLPILKSN